MNRILITSLTLLSVGTGVLSCTNQKEESAKPNILFIFSDDHATHAIGAYGPKHNNPELHRFVQTPHLDRLAQEGMLFNNVFCGNSICGIRSDRYKLIHFYTTDEWELFDLEIDPDEMKNEYLNPDYSNVVTTMKERLNKERIAVGDTVELKATSNYHR